MEKLVIIPTYNERENIDEHARRGCSRCPYGLEVLVVDDNSPDGTARPGRQRDGAASPASTCSSGPARWGWARPTATASATRSSTARSTCSRWTPTSRTTPTASASSSKHAQEADLVLGSRYLHGVTVVNWPLSRLILVLLREPSTRGSSPGCR